MSAKTIGELTAELAAAVDFKYADDGYNKSAEAMVTCAVAAFDWAASQVGATGFQASWAALTAYAKQMGIDGPLMVFQGANALYPQYDLPVRLNDWLTSDLMRTWLADQAVEKLAADSGLAHPNVEAHWRALVANRPIAGAS